MKFATSILALAIGASATIVTRDLATIQGVISDISKATDSLDSAVKAFSSDFGPLQSASDSLLSTIKGGITKVAASDVLPLMDAANVAQSVIALNTSASGVINDLISKKSALVAAGKGADTLKTLQDQRAAAKSLADAITSKVPSELRGTASQLSQGIDDAFARGITAFQGTGGGPSVSIPATSGSATATSTAASSSASHGGHSSSAAASSSSYPTKTAVAPPSASASKPATFTGAAAPFATGVSGALVAAMAVAMAL
jgi:hypothetical protein